MFRKFVQEICEGEVLGEVVGKRNLKLNLVWQEAFLLFLHFRTVNAVKW